MNYIGIIITIVAVFALGIAVGIAVPKPSHSDEAMIPANGAISNLSGRTVYLSFTNSAGLYVLPPQWRLSPTAAEGSADMRVITPTSAGTR